MFLYIVNIRLDIWGNVTKYQNTDIWVKQSFIKDEIISYHDSKGNYWTKEFSDNFPFIMYVFIKSFVLNNINKYYFDVVYNENVGTMQIYPYILGDFISLGDTPDNYGDVMEYNSNLIIQSMGIPSEYLDYESRI